MDVLSGISRALEFRWDVLIRIVASAAGLTTVSGAAHRANCPGGDRHAP